MPMGVGLWYNPRNEKVFNIALDGSGVHEVWIKKPENAEAIGLSERAQATVQQLTDPDEIRIAAIRDGLVRTREYRNHVSVTISARRGLRDLLFKVYQLIKSRYSPYAYVKISNLATGEDTEIHMPDFKRRLDNDEPILFREDTDQLVYDPPNDSRILRVIESKLRHLEDNTILESGLSKLYEHSQDHDFGIITACRSEYNVRENQQRNKSLKAKLRALRYGVTAIAGAYIENYGSENAIEVREDSYFVVDLLNKGTLEDDLRRLGEEFEQDSVLYGDAGDIGVLIGTSMRKDSYPGYGVIQQLDTPVFGKSGQFHSRVRGRPFVFESKIVEYGLAKYPTELRGPVAESKIYWRDIEL